MKRIAKFEKVSFKQYRKDWDENLPLYTYQDSLKAFNELENIVNVPTDGLDSNFLVYTFNEKFLYDDALKNKYEQFELKYHERKIKEVYDAIKLPARATTGSAGYDFFSPFNIKLEPGATIKIPTGIRCKMQEGWVLKCYPRSGLGFKFRLQLNNTVGIIDEDYYYSDNEGHIFAKITNDTNEGKLVEIIQGDGFMQGIFVEFGITEDDCAIGKRNGGEGSTTVKNKA